VDPLAKLRNAFSALCTNSWITSALLNQFQITIVPTIIFCRCNFGRSPPPCEDADIDGWYAWLLKKLIVILEYINDKVMPVVLAKVIVPVTFIVFISTLFPPLVHSAPAILSCMGIGIGSICLLNQALPGLINMLKSNLQYMSSPSFENRSQFIKELIKLSVLLIDMA
jgi:hypothetical protein